MKTKVLILGATGMLGKDVVDSFSSKECDIYAISRNVSDAKIKFYISDLTDFKKMREIVTTISPDIIVNCAACVNLSLCESDETYAYKVNAYVNKIVIESAPKNCRYIFVSTDSVFDGHIGDYELSDYPNPLNVYAKSKLMGESVVKDNCKNFVIIRTNLYGFHRNSGKSLAEWVIESLNNDDNITGYTNVYFNPLYTRQLAKLISELAFSNVKGLVHAGSNESLSKYEFCTKLAEQFGYKNKRISKGILENDSVIVRPLNTTLSTTSMKSMINMEFSIIDGLKLLYNDYLKEKH